MESFYLNVYKREQGSVFQEKTVGNVKGHTLTAVNHFSDGLCGRSFRFLHVAIYELGHHIVVGDNSGSVYMFDMEKNRFWLIIRLGKCCSAIAFVNNGGKNILVSTTDNMLYLLNSANGKKVTSVQARQSCIFHISIDKEGDRALTSSLELAVLWDLKMLNVLHNLTVKQSVDFVKAFFLPEKNNIVSAFKDGSVFLWDYGTLACLSHFSTDADKELKLRCIEASLDGELIVCAGKADWILVWAVENQQILFTMSLGIHLTSVRQLAFLPTGFLASQHHQVVVLSQEGGIFVYVLEMATLVLQTTVGNCSSMAIANKGKLLITIAPSGCMKMYDLELMFSAKEKAKPVVTLGTTQQTTKQGKVLKASHLMQAPSYQLDVNRLRRVVRDFGEYPPKYRFLIWQHLLKLPDNKEAFGALVEQGEHRLCQERLQEYAVVNQTLKNALLRILSYICHWCPLLAEVDYLPFLVFPFVKLLHRNLQMCFEVVLTLICNWCQNWFMYFPHVPLNILCAVENLLVHHDKQLMRHYVSHNITAQVYGWPLLNTVFSEVLSKGQWLQLWDHVISNEPSFLLYLVAAFNTVSHEILLHLHSFLEIKEYFHQNNNLPVSVLLKEAYHLQKTTPQSVEPSSVVGSFSPLTKKIYPLFTKYPQFKINLQSQDRKNICCEEVDYIHNRQIDLDAASPSYLQEVCSMEKNRNCEEKKIRNLREIQRLHNIRRDIIKQDMMKGHFQEHQTSGSTQNIKLQKVGHLLQKKLLTHQSEENKASQSLQSSHQKQKDDMKASFSKRNKGLYEESVSSTSPPRAINVVNDVINLRSQLASISK